MGGVSPWRCAAFRGRIYEGVTLPLHAFGCAPGLCAAPSTHAVSVSAEGSAETKTTPWGVAARCPDVSQLS
jgi:hypothetical protein